jgi:DNA-binding transcriptional MerR regulator
MVREKGAQRHALHPIKEAAELTGVPSYTLRLWERKLPGLLRPARSAGGHRLYSETDLQMIRKIDYFLNQKAMSFAGARRMIEEGIELGNEPDQKLKNRIMGDKRVRETAAELVHVIRKRVLEEV